MTKFLFPLFGSMALLIPQQADAQHCRSFVNYAPSVVVQKQVEVVTPVLAAAFVPITVPLYSVGYAPPIAVAPVAPTSVQSVQQQTTQSGVDGTTASQSVQNGPESLSDSQIDYLLKRIEQRLAAKQQKPSEPVQAPQVPLTPQAAPMNATPQTNGQLSAAGQLLTQKCASCHTGSATKGGGLAFFSNDNHLLNLDKGMRARIVLNVSEATMPPNAAGNVQSPNALTDPEVAILRAWAKGN